MKKKICVIMLFFFCLITLSACGKSKLNLNDYVIEKRETLFVACDSVYSVTFSTGVREQDYNLDGNVTELVPFGILTLTRLDNLPLANDNYSYIVTIGEQSFNGFLTKGINDNSYSADLEVNTVGDETINASISFTGYTFKQDLTNASKEFQVDCDSAIKIAESELKEQIENVTSDKNVKIEVITKIIKDHSNKDNKNYFWYVGIVSTNGDTIGILIDANTSEIIAKKS